jgi:hypothetical protein
LEHPIALPSILHVLLLLHGGFVAVSYWLTLAGQVPLVIGLLVIEVKLELMITRGLL